MGTGVLELLGGEVENRCVRSGPDSYSVIGEANTQVLSECAIPTSRQNLLQIQYLNPFPNEHRYRPQGARKCTNRY